jgi:hypothetical protein
MIRFAKNRAEKFPTIEPESAAPKLELKIDKPSRRAWIGNDEK